MSKRVELFRAAVVTGRGAGFVVSGGAARGAASTIHRIVNGKRVKQWKVPYALHACCAIEQPTVGLVAIAAEDRFVVLDDEGLHEGHVYTQCSPRPTRELYGQLTSLGSVAAVREFAPGSGAPPAGSARSNSPRRRKAPARRGWSTTRCTALRRPRSRPSTAHRPTGGDRSVLTSWAGNAETTKRWSAADGVDRAGRPSPRR